MIESAEVQDNEFDDLELDVEEYKFHVIEELEEEFIDVRDFVDCCFNNFSQMEGMVRKPVRIVVCLGNEEPPLAEEGEIAVLLNYKSVKGRGRKNILAGQDVLHISMPNGDFRVPLHQAEKFGKYLIGIARSANAASDEALPQSHGGE